LETAASQNYRSYAEYVVDRGGVANTGQRDPRTDPSTPVTQTNFPVNPVQTGGTTAPSTPQTYQFGGTEYNDPVAYANAVTEASMAEWNKQNKLLTEAYNSGLLDFAQYKEQLEQARMTVKDQYGQAMSSIGGRFSAMSPDAYQSSQGVAENRADDITKQNYSNIAGQEANLGRQRSQYDIDYANNLQANTDTRQSQIDQTINQTRGAIIDTPYANKMSQINAPKLNTMTPMDSGITGVYDSIAQQYKSGNMPAVQTAISGAQVDPNIKSWLYDRFKPQQEI
jgi:hypothetical protein